VALHKKSGNVVERTLSLREPVADAGVRVPKSCSLDLSSGPPGDKIADFLCKRLPGYGEKAIQREMCRPSVLSQKRVRYLATGSCVLSLVLLFWVPAQRAAWHSFSRTAGNST
jgi:hypothetical protein